MSHSAVVLIAAVTAPGEVSPALAARDRACAATAANRQSRPVPSGPRTLLSSPGRLDTLNKVMSFPATVLRVLVASPSDVPDARDAVEGALHSWNRLHATTRNVVLLPWRWETNSVPLLGGHPQEIINTQGVDGADIVVALFGSRLGSPTPDAVSGTVEEIERAVNSGKPVHLFFSRAPLPHDVDTAQLEVSEISRMKSRSGDCSENSMTSANWRTKSGLPSSMT